MTQNEFEYCKRYVKDIFKNQVNKLQEERVLMYLEMNYQEIQSGIESDIILLNLLALTLSISLLAYIIIYVN